MSKYSWATPPTYAPKDQDRNLPRFQRQDLINRLWASTEIKGIDECWPNSIALRQGPYGTLGYDYIKVGCHVLSLEIKLARYLREGYICCHTCNNTVCVNPNHLYEGTPKSNAIDSINNGHAYRNQVGLKAESSPRAVVNWDIVHEIRASNLSQRALAAKYNLAQSTIGLILRNETWKE